MLIKTICHIIFFMIKVTQASAAKRVQILFGMKKIFVQEDGAVQAKPSADYIYKRELI
jgi:hypothetical protein